jgi:hypothetical protein
VVVERAWFVRSLKTTECSAEGIVWGGLSAGSPLPAGFFVDQQSRPEGGCRLIPCPTSRQGSFFINDRSTDGSDSYFFTAVFGAAVFGTGFFTGVGVGSDSKRKHPAAARILTAAFLSSSIGTR